MKTPTRHSAADIATMRQLSLSNLDLQS